MSAIQSKQSNLAVLKTILAKENAKMFIAPFVNNITPTSDSVFADFTVPSAQTTILNLPVYDTTSNLQLSYRFLFPDLFDILYDNSLSKYVVTYNHKQTLGWKNSYNAPITIYGYIIFIEVDGFTTLFMTNKLGEFRLNPVESISFYIRVYF
jgi:hypothetical protein